MLETSLTVLTLETDDDLSAAVVDRSTGFTESARVDEVLSEDFTLELSVLTVVGVTVGIVESTVDVLSFPVLAGASLVELATVLKVETSGSMAVLVTVFDRSVTAGVRPSDDDLVFVFDSTVDTVLGTLNEVDEAVVVIDGINLVVSSTDDDLST